MNLKFFKIYFLYFLLRDIYIFIYIKDINIKYNIRCDSINTDKIDNNYFL